MNARTRWLRVGGMAVAALVFGPAAANAQSFFDCSVMHYSKAGDCFKKVIGEKIGDVLGFNAAADDVVDTVKKVPGYGSAEKVEKVTSTMGKNLFTASDHFADSMKGNMSGEEIDRQNKQLLQQGFIEDSKTADDVGGTGALSTLFGLKEKADEYWNNGVQNWEKIKQVGNDVVQSAQDTLGIESSQDTSPPPSAPVSSNSPAPKLDAAADTPTTPPEPPKDYWSDSKQKILEQEAADAAAAEAAKAPPAQTADAPATAPDAPQASEAPAAPAQSATASFTSSGGAPAKAPVGVVDIDTYHSPTLQEQSERMKQQILASQTGAIPVGGITLEDGPKPGYAPSKQDAFAKALADFAAADSAHSRKIEEERTDAEAERLSANADVLDEVVDQLQDASSQMVLQRQMHAIQEQRAKPVPLPPVQRSVPAPPRSGSSYTAPGGALSGSGNRKSSSGSGGYYHQCTNPYGCSVK